MLNEICLELRNFFNRDLPIFAGRIEIANNNIQHEGFQNAIQNGQYFRIAGSVFNDGVYKYDNKLELQNEIFEGCLWLMAVPREVIALDKEIEEWQKANAEVLNSPFSSESFAGYSYSKGDSVTWQTMFASKLNKWRKI